MASYIVKLCTSNSAHSQHITMCVSVISVQSTASLCTPTTCILTIQHDASYMVGIIVLLFASPSLLCIVSYVGHVITSGLLFLYAVDAIQLISKI